MCELALVFETERLRVFAAKVTPWEGVGAHGTHTLYVAFPKVLGAAVPVVHAVVSDWRNHEVEGLRCMFCQVIEVSSLSKGQRYGEELFLEIEKHLGVTLKGYAASEQGKKFLERLGRETDFGETAVEPARIFLERVRDIASQANNAALAELARGLLDITSDRSRQPSERLHAISSRLVLLEELLSQAQAARSSGDSAEGKNGS